MVFQRPNPFPQSIFDNVAFGPRVLGLHLNGSLTALVEESLRRADLWDEVKDSLHKDALGLSLGQQQRLCIARVIAVKPEVILMDEPCSALDPISTLKIEDLMRELAEQLHHRHRDAQHAAGRTRFRPHRDDDADGRSSLGHGDRSGGDKAHLHRAARPTHRGLRNGKVWIAVGGRPVARCR